MPLSQSPHETKCADWWGSGELLVPPLELGFPLFLLTLSNKQGLSAILGPLPPKHKGSRWPYDPTVSASHKVGGGGRASSLAPDEYRCVEQGSDGRHVDTHEHLAIDVRQPHVAILHLSVGLVIVQDQLHLQ